MEIGIFDYAFSPVEPIYMKSQRIINPDTKLKIKIYGKRIIKDEKKLEIKKIFRIQK